MCLLYGTEKSYAVKPDVFVVPFFHIIKTVARINIQLLSTKPNIKGVIGPCPLDHFLFILLYKLPCGLKMTFCWLWIPFMAELFKLFSLEMLLV